MFVFHRDGSQALKTLISFNAHRDFTRFTYISNKGLVEGFTNINFLRKTSKKIRVGGTYLPLLTTGKIQFLISGANC